MNAKTHQTENGGGLFAHLSHDLPASLVVFLIAVPLSLGIALASGAPLMAGLIAAIVGGIVVGTLGGAPLQVAGPAAGLTVVVYGFVQQFGWAGTCAITLGAGLLQILLGALGFAPLALGMSPAVIYGMLAAIGILIALSQIHVVLGAEPAGKGLKNVALLPENIMGMDVEAAIIGALTIGVLVVWPHLPLGRLRAFPGALAAVVLATIVSLVFPMELPRVTLGGDLLASLRLPQLPDASPIAIAGAVFALCFIASAESLLCAVATDKLHSGPRADLNRELVAQGVGNSLSGLLGGLPITGVIVRSTANISSGARTRLSAILHGVWVLVFVLFFGSVITKLPLAALAGLLVHTGFKLVNPKHIRELWHRGELPVYVITVGAIVGTNLLLGLAIGFGVAVLRLLWKLTHVEIHAHREGEVWKVHVDGTLTFAGVPRLLTRLQKLPAGQEVEVDLAVRYLDHAGFEALESWKRGYELTGGRARIDSLEEIWARSNGKTARRELVPAEVPA